MMISDAERREVAARLRHMTCDIADLKEAWRMQGLYTQCQDQADYYQIHNIVMGYFPANNMHVCDYEELHTRLADFIEPGVDRDALLKLVDKMEQETGPACGLCMKWSARSIRKALGVEIDH